MAGRRGAERRGFGWGTGKYPDLCNQGHAVTLPQTEAPALHVNGTVNSFHRSSALAPEPSTSLHGKSKPKRGLVAAYMGALERRPILTKCVTSGVICGIGDVMAQALTIGSRKQAAGVAAFLGLMDLRRLVIYALMGAVYLAPIVHYWFEWIDMIGPRGGKKPTLKARVSKAGKMVAVDQLIGAPLVNAGFIFMFTFFTLLTAGGFAASPFSEGLAKVSSSIWPTLQGCWKLWPVANMFSFLVIPPHLRVLFMNIVGLGWNIFLSSAVN
ncbi:unnamed protein product [Discosporangium mesarthrocarpum]